MSTLDEIQDKIAHLLEQAYLQAKKSPDNSNQNGAVLVNEYGEILSESCNKFTSGIEATEVNLERSRKYMLIEHAERNVIYAAAAKGIKTTAKILICPWFACADCARAIANAKIDIVIGHKPRMDLTPERWLESVNCGNEILDKAGVLRYYYPDKLNLSFSIIVNGEEWTP